jgi:hypothetical protein
MIKFDIKIKKMKLKKKINTKKDSKQTNRNQNIEDQI